jgi:hypothetical protein
MHRICIIAAAVIGFGAVVAAAEEPSGPPGGRSAGDARGVAGERNPELRSEPRGDHPTRRNRSGDQADPACYRLDNADISTSGHSGRQPGGQTEIARVCVAAQQRPSKLSRRSRIRISVRPKRSMP